MQIAKDWENPVRAKLAAGKPVIGATITAGCVEMAAQAASLGFDFLWVEMEHSPVTLETLRNVVLATRGLPAVPFARVPSVEAWMAKRVLDMGALGVVFPFTSTPELAQLAAASTKYPPKGIRGHGSGLATFRWPAEEGYPDFADRNVMTITMVEEYRAVEKIDEIAATPGIDVIFIGTSDLAFNMGLRGDQTSPELHKAIDKVLNATHKHGKVAGRPAFNTAMVPQLVSQGFHFLQAPAEVKMMAEGAKYYLDALGNVANVSKAAY
ncbi:MAG: aldolase [Bryobacterales bacterium]|nr:aldolase [Bryobacterales bacterium]